MQPATRLAAVLILAWTATGFADPPKTGPDTEKRFPPLKVPAGFKATLFACDPLIEYPSVIAPGFKPGTLLVAIDYMTGLGTEIVRRDEIRLLEDTDGDGYADRATVLADGFNSIQGLAQHNGTVYVMHAPYLTALRDTKGTGKADERKDLLTGLGLPPEQDQIRLHNANGVVLGHDGWLYLALGDRGCKVKRPEGDTLVLEGGGVLRCRPDGRDLHDFSGGLRNIYDVALDAELNVLVRDNENDGGTYKVRVCHSFFGADHGYPFLYDERPDEALPPVSDRGLGAPAGGLVYLERQFPAEYRGDLLFCEWGRAVVRSRMKRSGATFGSVTESDFLAGAPDDPYGFKPTDLVVDRDGSLFVSDWADGQRPRRGRGRIYHLRHTGDGKEAQPIPADDLIGRLNSDSYHERREAQEGLEARGKDGLAVVLNAMKKDRLGPVARLHAVWVLAKVESLTALDRLLDIAKSDPDPRVQAQAIKAVADRTDPVLVKQRLDAGPGDEAVGRRIADLAGGRDCDPRVRLEAILALGRLRWAGLPEFLREGLKQPDPALAHAAQWALRQTSDRAGVLELLDLPGDQPTRAVARRALAGRFDEQVVDGLIDRLRRDTDAGRRREYAELLIRVYKKPGPWEYWGFRPKSRPANSVAWKPTERIGEALDRALPNLDAAGRTAVLRQMVREKVAASAATLGKLLRDERGPEHVAAVLAALAELPAADTLPTLEGVLRDRGHTHANRLLAAAGFLRGVTEKDEKRLLAAAEAVEDGPVLAELLRALGTRKTDGGVPHLLRKVTSTDADVRMRAVEALAEIGTPEARAPVEKLLDDPDARVRAAAALAAGKLTIRSATDRLLARAGDPAAPVRAATLVALRRLGERRAQPAAVRALADRETAPAALDYLATLGGPEQTADLTELARRDPSAETLSGVGRVLSDWLRRDDLKVAERDRVNQGLARLHGTSGLLLAWHVDGAIGPDDADRLLPQLAPDNVMAGEITKKWPVRLSSGMEARLSLGPVKRSSDSWFATTDIEVSEGTPVEFSASSTGLETVWLNGKEVFRRDKPGVIGPYPDRFEASLTKGPNYVLVRLTGAKETGEFQLRFRRKGAAPHQERYASAALSRAGNPAHGREIFLNLEKSQCAKCHRVGDVGERFGPELTGLGSRFSKVHIIESILEPSRAVSPSFEGVVMDLKDGRSLTGLKVDETETTVVLIDAQAKKHSLVKVDIEARRKSTLSPMPEGLEKALTEDEFVDLVSYLVSLKAPPGK